MHTHTRKTPNGPSAEQPQFIALPSEGVSKFNQANVSTHTQNPMNRCPNHDQELPHHHNAAHSGTAPHP